MLSTTSTSPSDRALVWQCQWVQAFPTLYTDILLSQDGTDQIWLESLAWRSLQDSASFGTVEPWSRTSDAEKTRTTPSGTTTNNNSVALDSWQGSYGYGEILPTEVAVALHRLEDLRLLLSTKDSVVVDLGSGDGRVLLAAVTARPFGKAVGIEILPSLHEKALAFAEYWEEHNAYGRSVELAFACADFTVDTGWIAEADLIFCHATVFEDALMAKLSEMCGHCRSGTLFVMISRPLENQLIETVDRLWLSMNWGAASCFLQRRR